ncbi:MAG TPA: DUF1573 domain-containing protein [Candidatus Limnocylindrales bacterium]|nr:DUF1573 domain-containing protein [Candidatus Limnocylindrales bacterium]
MTARNVMLSLLMLNLGMVLSPADPPPTTPAPAAPVPPGVAVDTNTGAKIDFATPIYDFGKVKGGDPVKYTYYFTNSGTEVLEVKAVQPSCGCTTAGEFSKKVEPGKTGTIPIQFNSANFNGQVFKTITVTSSAKNSPTTVLQLKGTIWKAIELVPAYTVLNIPPDAQSGSATVRITNNVEEALHLFAPTSSNPAFSAELITNSPGKGFELTILGKKPLQTGTMNGQITLKTSSTNTPSLTVPFWANVQAPLMVFPAVITLQPALTNKLTSSITIQNNSTNQLTVSEAEINIPGVELQMKEMTPGRVFSAQLVFPEGFKIPQGKDILFTAKSSNPDYPVIRVPIRQLDRPTSPPAVPPAPAAAAPRAQVVR